MPIFKTTCIYSWNFIHRIPTFPTQYNQTTYFGCFVCPKVRVLYTMSRWQSKWFNQRKFKLWSAELWHRVPCEISTNILGEICSLRLQTNLEEGTLFMNLMFIEPCIIVIVEEW